MYCRKCARRESCVEICQKLEAHLKSRETYQREICLEPGDLALVAEEVKVSWPDLLPDYPWMWDQLGPFLDALPVPALQVFVLHFHDGRTVGEISRSLNIHRATVNRRLGRAVRLLKRALARESRLAARRRRRLKSGA
ncbi:MAG TPA: sigma factor-like helix-turn-helix DNA-binding protein [bacterium]|nr:sigma factor-like helix-turn-helix DNA-binding protein [bacterium]